MSVVLERIPAWPRRSIVYLLVMRTRALSAILQTSGPGSAAAHLTPASLGMSPLGEADASRVLSSGPDSRSAASSKHASTCLRRALYRVNRPGFSLDLMAFLQLLAPALSPVLPLEQRQERNPRARRSGMLTPSTRRRLRMTGAAPSASAASSLPARGTSASKSRAAPRGRRFARPLPCTCGLTAGSCGTALAPRRSSSGLQTRYPDAPERRSGRRLPGHERQVARLLGLR